MRTFESPTKHVSDLIRPQSVVMSQPLPPQDKLLKDQWLKPTNLLKSRKTCEKKQLNISELLSID